VIDTHAHLDSQDAAADLERARAAGVERVITVSTTVAGAEVALRLAHALEGVHASLGIHPHHAADAEAERLGELRELLVDPRAVAVGETGLDYAREHAPRREQRRLFDAQLALADELGLPVVIHAREADDDTLAALAPFAGLVVLHCFSSPALLPAALERGWYVSFAGNLTYPSAVALRDAARLVPSERLLAETDSPYLAPQPRRGERNEPSYVLHTLALLAELRGADARELGAQIDLNATAVFSL